MTEPHPVIVVGAGPVGMTAALALRALDLPVTVLEADGEHRSRPGSRAIFLHRESLEHLESVSEGLGWEIAQHGIVWTTKKTYYGENLVYERTYPPPDPTRLKAPHNYVGRVVATIFTCGLYAFWWEYDVMTEGNRHFTENWRWEDDLAQSVQQLAAA